MNRNVRKSFVLVAVVMAVMLALLVFAGVASTQGAVTNSPDKVPAAPGPDLNWQDKVPKFQENLKKAGFNVHAASFAYIDLVDLNCHDQLVTSLANNPWPNAYLVLTDTHLLEPMYYPDDLRTSDKFPWFWQLREDEAFVMVGETPPESAYFSYMTVAMFLPDDPVTPNVEKLRVVGAQLGDTTNNKTIRTIGSNPYNTPIVYIITGHRLTERLVRAAATAAGYPNAMINVKTISPKEAPLGLGLEGSVFYMANRAAVPADHAVMEEYIKTANDHMKVFRVTPIDPDHPGVLGEEPVFADDPEPVSVLIPKGTGHTEMELYPALQNLRKAIVQRYSSDYPYRELDTKIWTLASTFVSGTLKLDLELNVEKPNVVLQRSVFNGGGTRDNNYLGTYPNFKLRSDVDEFVIVYGVNHQATGKSTYASFSLYADKYRWIGIGTKLSPDFDTPCKPHDCPPGEPGDSARQYLSPDDPAYQYADMLYAWKVARHCNGEPYCMEVADPVKFDKPDGSTYYCKYVDPELFPNEEVKLFNEEMFFLFRNYMEPATKVGPDDNELVYDRAVYFGPYFATP